MDNKTYRVTAIQEDLDFGCEERSADSPVMAVVILQGKEGAEKMTRLNDQLMYERRLLWEKSLIYHPCLKKRKNYSR